MQSTTIRISDSAREVLRELAAKSGESMQSMLEKVIEDYRQRHFWQEVNDAYARLRESPAEWQAELEERRVLEGTIDDGIEAE